jgi:hypothetical protein
MKNLFCCLITPPRGRPTPEMDPHERHDAHNWRESKAKRLEKEKKNLWRAGSRDASEVRDVIRSLVRLSSVDLGVQQLGRR